MARKPKETVKKATSGQKTNCLTDDESEAEQQSNRAKTTSLPKRAPKRSAQEIANSMKGSNDLTSTSIKLDRLRRSPPSNEKSPHDIPWLKGITDGEDTDDLPELTAVQANLKQTIPAKRPRDPSPNNDKDVVPVTKKGRSSSPDNEELCALEQHQQNPRSRSATVLKSQPNILTPKRSSTRIMASPVSSPVFSLPAIAASDTTSGKQALFRSPSVDRSDLTQLSKIDDSSDTEVSEVDELQQDTKEWMDENVEIID